MYRNISLKNVYAHIGTKTTTKFCSKRCLLVYHNTLQNRHRKTCYRTFASNSNGSNSPRFSLLDIQMLSETLHKQIFHGSKHESDSNIMERCVTHLKEHNLWRKSKSSVPDVNMELPKLLGANIDEHFKTIARQQSKPYFDLSEKLASVMLPPVPEEWEFVSGWSKYEKTENGYEVIPIEYPEEDGLVFDVEVCQNEGPFPTLAIAASATKWYAWVSPKLVEEKSYQWLVRPTPSLMIPLESTGNQNLDRMEWREKLVIGHSVGFDRSYVQEQYYIKGPKTYFLDTLSLHMCISGLTGHQRLLWNAHNAGRKASQEWMDVGSGNKLEHLYKLYCGQDNLDKSSQAVFIEGDLDDIRSQFQELMTYCANDVASTHEIFTVIWPIYKDRFPHPVSFTGMLEMGSAYLPVDESWDNYIRDADNTFDDLEKEMKGVLMKLADEACNYQHGQR